MKRLPSPLLIFLISLFCGLPITLIGQGFVDITEDAGIDHQFKVFEGMFGGGICVFDMDNDGFEDVFMTSGMNEDVLYRNHGNGTFTNAYEGSGLEITRKYVTQGVAGADINRDGWVDLFVTTINTKNPVSEIPRAKNLLFLNKGDGTFDEVGEAYGIEELVTFSTGPSFGDFNADGWPDVYVGNYFHEYEGGLDYISDATIVNIHQTAKGHLLLNKSGKRFVNVYEDYGLDFKGFSFGGVFTDFDNDGDQDIIVNHDFGYKRTPNLFLENLYPKKEFKDVAEAYEMDLKINSMGTAIADINDDGLMDYFFSNIKFNWMMMSQGEGEAYENQLKEKGMSIFTISWGSNFADFDHDGDMDLYVANGDLNPNCTPMADFFFENENGKFSDKGRAYGINDYGIGRGSVVFDIENDGDLDVLVINQEAVKNYPVSTKTRLYRNDLAKGNWLKVALKGIQSESRGLGSRVEIAIGAKRMMREIDGGGSSHLSQNSTIAHFGIGDETSVDSIVISWTGGNKQTLLNPPINQLVQIEESPKPKSSSIGIVWIIIPIVLLVFIWFRFFR